jgi:copper chaperone CopZ
VRVALKAVPGVDSVEVSLNKGLATLELKPGNNATLKQLQDAIAKNGFTTKQSEVTVRGQLIVEGGKSLLQVTGTNEKYDLVPEQGAPDSAAALVGKLVVVDGTVPETLKGKAPDVIRYRSLREEVNR